MGGGEKFYLIFYIFMKGEDFSRIYFYMFGMELANQIMISVWEYVGKRRITWHWIKQIFDLIKFVIRVTARVDDGNLKIEKAQGTAFSSIAISFAFVQRNRGARYNLYCVYNTEIIMLLQVYFISIFAREFGNYTFSWNK